MDKHFEPSHVPQQNLRSKLRVPQLQQQSQFPLAMNYPSPLSCNNLSLSPPGNPKDLFLKQSSSDHQVRLSLVPLGPFTGYSSILMSSKFLGPAQEVLKDTCGGNCKCLEEVPPLDLLVGNEDVTGAYYGGGLGCGGNNSKLVLMLDEMYRRYKLYCQQLQSVLVSFGSVAGLGNTAPYVGCAIKVVSKYFTCLKSALLDQILSTPKITSKDKTVDPRFVQNADSAAVTMRLLQNPVWRSQRGLPDQAVSVLKTWLFEHFLHPYPTDSEKQSLAQQTGLSRTQVSNWFINARVRLWKPMVEEVHMLESQQSTTTNHNNSLAVEPSSVRGQCQQANKRHRSELPDAYKKPQDPVGEMSCRSSSKSNEVSLALGLHHNNGLDLSWPLPMDMAQHVNLEMIRMVCSASATSSNAFKSPPDQHFGRDP